MDTYVKTYFRINAGYVWGKGMEEASLDTFHKEVQACLERIGFRVLNPAQGMRSLEMIRGKEYLYCHPMDLTGPILLDSRPGIESVLAGAKSFSLRAVDEFETFLDLTPEQYRRELEQHVPLIRRRMFEAFVPDKRGRLFEEKTYRGISTKDLVSPFLPSHFSVPQGERNEVLHRNSEVNQARDKLLEWLWIELLAAGAFKRVERGDGKHLYAAKSPSAMARMRKSEQARLRELLGPAAQGMPLAAQAPELQAA